MKLFVIRHGQTDYNAQRRFQGQADIPLNPVGETQARRSGLILGQLLRTEENEYIRPLPLISSDLRRTKETTQIVCSELENSESKMRANVLFDSRLREFHCGSFENCTYDEFVLAHPEIAADYMEQYNKDNYATRYPGNGGESRLDVMARVGQVLHEVQEQFKSRICIWVVHGGVIDVLLELMHIQTHDTRAERISAGNGDVLVLKHAEKSKHFSTRSLALGHECFWQLERHYRIGDTIAAKVVR